MADDKKLKDVKVDDYKNVDDAIREIFGEGSSKKDEGLLVKIKKMFSLKKAEGGMVHRPKSKSKVAGKLATRGYGKIMRKK